MLKLSLRFPGCWFLRPVRSQQPPGVVPNVRTVGIVSPGERHIGGGCVINIPCNHSQQHGYYAHPTNCSNYYQCDSNRDLVEKSCPAGLTWHFAVRTCVQPENSNCQSGCPEGSYQQQVTTTEVPWIYGIGKDCEVVLPCNKSDPNTGGRYAHPDNCGLYYFCQDNGDLFQTDCNGTQQYDPQEKRCLDRGRAQCLSVGTCPAGSRRKQKNGGPATTTTITRSTKPPHAPGPCNPPAVCTMGQKLPDVYDCLFYFECVGHNQWNLTRCAGTLQFFDSVSLVCSSARTFNTDRCAPSCPGGFGQISPSPDPGTKTTTIASSIMNISDNCEVDLPCNDQFPSAYRYIPHPDNCSAYWECLDSGQMIEKSCAQNTMFNITSRNCDIIRPTSRKYCQSGCPDGSRPRVMTTTTTSTTTTTAATPPFATAIAPSIMNISNNCEVDLPCNDQFPSAYRYIPHPDNCSAYWECLDSGQMILKSCGQNAMFNVTNRNCDFIRPTSRKYCQSGCPDGSRPRVMTTTTTSTTTTTAATPPVAPRDDEVCKAEIRKKCDPRGTELADHTDCGLYLRCTEFGWQTQRCGPDNFDAVENKCRDPSVARCHPPCPTTTSTTTSTTTMSTPSTKTITDVSTTTHPPSLPPSPTTTSAIPTTTTKHRPSTTTTSTYHPGTYTTDSILRNYSLPDADNGTSTTTEKTSTTTENQANINQTGHLWDPADREDIVTSPSSLNEQSTTTMNPSKVVTDKGPPVTSDGILLPSEFVTPSPLDSMLLSSSLNNNPTTTATIYTASLTYDDSSLIVSSLSSDVEIQTQSQLSQAFSSVDVTTESYTDLTSKFSTTNVPSYINTETEATSNSVDNNLIEISKATMSPSLSQTMTDISHTPTASPSPISGQTNAEIENSAYDISSSTLLTSESSSISTEVLGEATLVSVTTVNKTTSIYDVSSIFNTDSTMLDSSESNTVTDDVFSSGTTVYSTTDASSDPTFGTSTLVTEGTLSTEHTTGDITSLNSDSSSLDVASSTIFSSMSTDQTTSPENSTWSDATLLTTDRSSVETSPVSFSTILSSLSTDQLIMTESSSFFTAQTTTELEASSTVDTIYSSAYTTNEDISKLRSSLGTTGSTSLPSSIQYSHSSPTSSSYFELTASEPTTSPQLGDLGVTTELIPGSTVSVDVNAELTTATNLPNSILASASVDAGGTLGIGTTDHMGSPHDLETTTPGIGPSVTGRCKIYCSCNCA